MAEEYGQGWQIEGTGYHGDREIHKSRAFSCEEEDNKCMKMHEQVQDSTKPN